MADAQDWKPVVLRKAGVAANKTVSGADLNNAMRRGEVEAVAKVKHTAPANARKLEEEDTDFRHASLSVEFKVCGFGCPLCSVLTLHNWSS
jgi:hypothetical protein